MMNAHLMIRRIGIVGLVLALLLKCDAERNAGALLVRAHVREMAAEQIDKVCNISYRDDDQRIGVFKIHNVNGLFFQSKMSCDVDGAPNAYHPLDDRLALDDIVSAGGERADDRPDGILTHWPSREVVAYREGRPYVQPDGDYAGFYVSKTSLAAAPNSECEANDYLDARHIQYIVLPDGLVPGVELGDVAVAYDPVSSTAVYCVYGDMGPTASCGEASLATLQRLNYATSDGRTSPAEGRRDIFYIVFPGSAAKLNAAKWPLDQRRIDALGAAELKRWGGVERIKRVLAR